MMKYMEKHPMSMILVGILGISLSAIFVKYSTAPSQVTAAWRLLWTVALMTPVALGRRENRRELCRAGRFPLLLSALSGVFLAVHFVLWFESLRFATVASATTIVCTEVVWVCLGYCLLLRGRVPPLALAAIALTLAGSVMIAWGDSGAGSQLYGDILALLAAVAVAAYTLIGRVVRSRLSTTGYTYVVYTACAVVLTAFCLVRGTGLASYGWNPILIGLLLAVFSTILGHSIFSWCLKYFSPAFVSASKLCEPVVAAMIAVFAFGEIPTLPQILGGGLILGGVFWYSRLEGKGE